MLAVRKQRQVICKVCGTCACVNDNSIACEPVVRLETSGGGGGNISENKGSYRVDVTTSVRSPDYEYEAMLITTIIWLFFPCNWWNCGTFLGWNTQSGSRLPVLYKKTTMCGLETAAALIATK